MDSLVVALKTIVTALNALSPLGLAAMLSFIIYQMVAKKGTVRAISDNHLSGLPEMADTLTRIERAIGEGNNLLVQIVTDIAYLKGRANGK